MIAAHSSGAEAALCHNGVAIPRDAVPWLSLDDFRRFVISAPATGRRVSALFGVPAPEPDTELIAVLADDANATLAVARTAVAGERYPSMTSACPEVHLFEREIAEQWGVVAEGHPWLKPVRFETTRAPGAPLPPSIGVTDFYRVAGEEVHEVAVGPVHAGVIEPGHFRFQCHGEEVFHLEISLGYQHRGIERALAGGPTKRTIHQMETAAGDTSVGHATAYCQIYEALSGAAAPPRALAIRGIALELERLANHTGDLGALAGDIAFLPTAAYCGRLRGDFLNLTAALCGSRFGRGLVRPSAAGFDVGPGLASQMIQRLDRALRDVKSAAELLFESPSVLTRFESTGTVSPEVALRLGLVGVAARACGLERDARRDHPSGIFQFAQIPLLTLQTGDVFARAYVRWLEIESSGEFVRQLLENLPAGSAGRSSQLALAPDRLVVSLVEGWRGEICHVARTRADGRFEIYKVVDPSFHNWSGLAMALRGQQISDFPLCNKSFNLSYAGHDL